MRKVAYSVYYGKEDFSGNMITNLCPLTGFYSHCTYATIVFGPCFMLLKYGDNFLAPEEVNKNKSVQKWKAYFSSVPESLARLDISAIHLWPFKPNFISKKDGL